MNLYAICPEHAPPTETVMVLAEGHPEAFEHASWVTRHDQEKGYCSPSTHVYLVAEDVTYLGAAGPPAAEEVARSLRSGPRPSASTTTDTEETPDVRSR